ncbi:Alcohol dehydrogenase 2 [Colletotrichum chlorophyti]|uniref:Alcohol dehydrogenase 2 n=1 Tax=Colletotrichum chlorophyti TaxID=708187 RepID=A0A1Q8RPX5_9PEZI|nr:Alcohol dehydrogenase 2 [Colletotrichum chlorophyti]
MQAFQYNNPKEGLQLRTVPIPTPGPGYVQIRVKAAGLCHSDCHVIRGGTDDWAAKRPITLGHEISGVVETIGPDVVGYQTGDRVAVAQIAHPIEERNLTLAVGLGDDGGYAEYVVAHVCRIVRIPDGVTFAQAAVATDAMATAYHAVVTEAKARSELVVGIIGIGGLGMQAVAFSVLRGAEVYAIDIVKAKFDEASRLGAKGCYESIHDAIGVEFDVLIDFAGTGSTTHSALEKVKEGGKVIVVGLGSAEIAIPSPALVIKSISLIGSLGASRDDLLEVLQLLASGLITPKLKEVPFADIPAGLDALDKGGVQGRLWADPSGLDKDGVKRISGADLSKL